MWRWRKAPVQAPRVKQGRRCKLTPEQERWCVEHVLDNPCTTLTQLQALIQTNLGVSVSVSLAHRLLRKHRITRKKATKHFCDQDQQKVDSFLAALPDAATREWLALDECGFVMNHAPMYGYSPKGARVVISRPGPRGQRYSLVLCISPSGVVAWELVKGGLKGPHFLSFLQSLPERTTLCMDNASIHHASKQLRKQKLPTVLEAASARRQTLAYLPAYSPQLNPTELCFNVIRSLVASRQPRNYDQLHDAVTRAIAHITPISCQGFFNHCWDGRRPWARRSRPMQA